MEKTGKITGAGVLYIPSEFRDDLGREVKLVDAPGVVLVFSERKKPGEVLESLNLLREELRLRRKEHGIIGKDRKGEEDGDE